MELGAASSVADTAAMERALESDRPPKVARSNKLTQPDVDNFRTLQDIFEYACMDGSAAEPDSQTSSWLKTLKVKTTTPLRLLGHIPEETYWKAMEAWKPGGEDASPLEIAQAAVVGAMLTCSVWPRTS